MADEAAGGQGLKSLDTALSVLGYMATQQGPKPLSQIARDCDMPPSKIHRYLASFVAAGLVKQDERSGRYDLGPHALQLGLAALARHDFVSRAAEGMEELSEKTGMTVLLSVWANEGATVVRWERGAEPTDTSVGLGSTLPILSSATGRVFLAWGPQRAIAPVRDKQIRRIARQRHNGSDFEPTQSGVAALVRRTREHGFAHVEGRFIPGLVAAAAPVLDWQNEVQAAITLVGVDAECVMVGSPQSRMLLDYCENKSMQVP